MNIPDSGLPFVITIRNDCIYLVGAGGDAKVGIFSTITTRWEDRHIEYQGQRLEFDKATTLRYLPDHYGGDKVPAGAYIPEACDLSRGFVVIT